jgi:hypothetical protein
MPSGPIAFASVGNPSPAAPPMIAVFFRKSRLETVIFYLLQVNASSESSEITRECHRSLPLMGQNEAARDCQLTLPSS